MGARGKPKRNANGQGGVYRRADGRWEAKVFVETPDGRRKRISVYGNTERAALDELVKILDQKRRGIPTATTVNAADMLTSGRKAAETVQAYRHLGFDGLVFHPCVADTQQVDRLADAIL